MATVNQFYNYQLESRKTCLQVETNLPIAYHTLGLTNEVGEVAGKVKKIFRDHRGVISEEMRQELKHELGDVLWYFAQICTELQLSMDEVAEANLTKVFSRYVRNTIQGSGDHR